MLGSFPRKMLAAVLVTAVALPLMAVRIGHTDRNGYPVVIPTVKKLQPAAGVFRLPAMLTVAAPQELDLAPLKRWYSSEVSGGKIAPAGEGALCRFALASAAGLPASPEGYRLTIAADGIRVTARDVRGLYYGMQTLCWMLRNRDDAAALKNCAVTDWPDLALRGFFFELPGQPPSVVPRLCKVIDLLGALKYNAILIEFADNFPLSIGREFDRPRGTFSRDDIAAIMAAAKRNHIELIPKLQIASHTAWLTRHADWAKMTEGKPRNHWCSNYCLSNDQAKKIVETVVRETVDLVKPRRFHMGLDEMDCCPYGICPKCKGKDPVELFLAHVLPIQKMLFDRGVTPVVYQDQFVTGNPFRRGNTFVPALDRMDRRVIVNSWEYAHHPNPTELLDIRKRGFKNFVYMSWVDRICNTMNLPKLGAKYGAQGCILAYWYEMRAMLDDEAHANYEALPGLVCQSVYSWNGKAPDLVLFPFDAHREVRKILDPEEAPKFAAPAAALPLGAVFNRAIGSGSLLWPRFDARLAEEIRRDAAADPAKFALAVTPKGGICAAVPGSAGNAKAVTIPVGSTAEGASFLLAAAPFSTYRYTGHRPVHGIGSLLFRYADGKNVNVPLAYRFHLHDWNSFFGTGRARIVLRVNDLDGALVNFYSFDWRNPRPGVPIREIVFTNNKGGEIDAALFAVSLYGAKVPAGQTAAPAALRSDPPFRIPPLRKLVDFAKPDALKQLKIVVTGKYNGRWSKSIVSEPGRGKVLEVKVPQMVEGCSNGRVIIDIPIAPDTKFETLCFEVKCDRPDAIVRADAYIIGKPGNSARRNYDRGFDTKWNTVRIPFEALSQKENGGAKLGKYIRISFFTSNADGPVSFRIANVGFSDAKLPGRFTIRNKVTE